jgi:hypothetical protein
MESSPGCWQAYGEVLAREYGDRAFWPAHRLTSDTYAVQHPGKPSPVTIQSVGIHLMSLHLVLERGAEDKYVRRAMGVAPKMADMLRWLTPPVSMGTITVAHVREAVGPSDHVRLVREWAESVWGAWRDHHDTIRQWTSQERVTLRKTSTRRK